MNAVQRGIAERAGRDFSIFATVDAWVFDLDNTLYPRHTNLYAQVDQRIGAYVERLLSLKA